MSYQDDNAAAHSGTRTDDERQSTRSPGQPPASGCMKGCFYGMAGCGCLTVIMVVALGVVSWKAFDMVKRGSSTDPATIRAATLEIAEINPPAGLEPKIKLELILVKAIVYQSKDGKSLFALVQPNPQVTQLMGIQNQFEGQIPVGFAGQGRDIKVQELSIQKTETREVMIRGQNAKVNFSEAKNSAGKEFRIVGGKFQGKTGPVEFHLHEPLENYDEADVKKFLESIK